ncbi:hypothetical protein GCM10011521_18720 [Arenimonas soli]|uniref:Lipoprotein n=1 Tax=Arenimonas soli TaxID=2269504 RepID=A0ABQ1HKX2_9GAMM|nr:hypothetical protein [Arenimonas soli]GGA80665.1 hypothetical protein GCM10011521_18720 [Arenimonas soli]
MTWFKAACVLVLGALAACSSPLPSRSDCIVLATARPSILDEASSLTGVLGIAQEAGLPLAGYTVREEGLYLQFSSRCEAKAAMARELLAELQRQRPQIEIQFSVSEQEVLPSVDTIDVRGASWRDPGNQQ